MRHFGRRSCTFMVCSLAVAVLAGPVTGPFTAIRAATPPSIPSIQHHTLTVPPAASGATPTPQGAHRGMDVDQVSPGEPPIEVVDGHAHFVRRHNPGDVLTLSIGLEVRNSAQLTAAVVAASDPASSRYGHYLTNEQYMAQFAPTPQHVRAVRTWLERAGLVVSWIAPDDLFIMARGTTRQVEHAFDIQINDYATPASGVFFANDRPPVMPDMSLIDTFVGLTAPLSLSAPQPRVLPFLRSVTRTTASPILCPGLASIGRSQTCYTPNDVRAAYNVTAALGDGTGQTIGFIRSGDSPVPDAALAQFATDTQTIAITTSNNDHSSPNVVEYIPVNGTLPPPSDNSGETAVALEYAHGIAPNSHLRVWMTTGQDASAWWNDLKAFTTAANDTSVHIVVANFATDELPALLQGPQTTGFVQQSNAEFLHAASHGTTFYVGLLNYGKQAQYPGPPWPGASPWVVAVGGTHLIMTSTHGLLNWTGETTFNGTQGGCTTYYERPWWQTHVTATSDGGALCTGRAVPDVAADADGCTGLYVYPGGATNNYQSAYPGANESAAVGIWGGLAAVLSQYLQHQGRAMGFAAPRLYQIGSDYTAYTRDFHDITSTTSVTGPPPPLPAQPCNSTPPWPAGPGWDESTGLGSANLANLAQDWLQPAPPPALTLNTSSGYSGITPLKIDLGAYLFQPHEKVAISFNALSQTCPGNNPSLTEADAQGAISLWTETPTIPYQPTGTNVAVCAVGATSHAVARANLFVETSPSSPVLGVTPFYGPPGQPIIVRGLGFGASQSVTALWFHCQQRPCPTGIDLGTGTVQADGSLTIPAAVPANSPSGISYIVALTGTGPLASDGATLDSQVSSGRVPVAPFLVTPGYAYQDQIIVSGGSSAVGGSTSVPVPITSTDYVVPLHLTGAQAAAVYNEAVYTATHTYNGTPFADVTVWYTGGGSPQQLDIDYDSATYGAWSPNNIMLWFKLQAPLGPAPALDSNYVLAWGNPSPVVRRSWADLYPLQDDFLGSSLDANKWTTIGLGYTIGVTNGMMTITGRPGILYSSSQFNPGYAESAYMALPPGALEISVGLGVNPASPRAIGDSALAAANPTEWLARTYSYNPPLDLTVVVSDTASAQLDVAPHVYSVGRDLGGQGYFWRDGAAPYAPTDQRYSLTGTLSGGVAVNQGSSAAVDWIKIRPWIPNGPTASVAVLPSFSPGSLSEGTSGVGRALGSQPPGPRG